MTRAEIFYLFPYVIFLGLSLGVLFYVWRRRNVKGGGAFTWYVAGRTLTIFAFILELISIDIASKIFWDKFQWFGELLGVVVLPIFAVQYAEYSLKNSRKLFALSLVIPLLFALALLTDDLHHLMYPNPRLSTDSPFPELTYDFTWVVYGLALYGYPIVFWVLGILARHFLEQHSLPRIQTSIIILGFLIPVIGSIFSLFGISITPQRDMTPFTATVGNIFLAWGLFRFGLFDIVPIARGQVLENLPDQILVLDAQDRVIDINQAALKILDQTSSEIIGKSGRTLSSQFAELLERFKGVHEIATEIQVLINKHPVYYEFKISPIYDRKMQLAGRIILAHDITKRKILEDGYKRLSEELEIRVRERTDELRKSAERYRAVVEHQMEFIVRWKEDGTRTFANEAYCRYFGLTQEQAISSNFLLLVAPEDRQTIEEKILRLQSGTVEFETEVHRVIKPDGTMGWQEWTDQAIRDESGKVVEFQSVGRDITERKLAEQSLLNEIVFNDLMLRMLTRLATCTYDELDAGIETCLGEIAEFMGADYCDILLLSEDRSAWTTTHKWSAAHMESVAHPQTSIPTGKLTWSEDMLFKGKTIRISTLDDFPPEAKADREFSEAEGAKSILSVPIKGMGQLVYGCIDLIAYANRNYWSESNVTHLKIIGDLLANTLERKRAEENLAEAYDTTLEGWAKALEFRDKETEGHSRRVTETTVTVARAMEFTEQEIHQIRRGSILHDIGKIAIPDEILKKPGPLTDDERAIVMKHPQAAYDLLVKIPHLKQALEIPYNHHEKWDGTGYPRGLKGDAIPLTARIFAIVDVWDALNSERPYRPAWEREKVVKYLQDQAGIHFDPEIVDIFLELMEQGRI